MEERMRELTPETIADAVLDQMATTPDPRMREVMASAVKHLHAFAREVNLTPAEWIKGYRIHDRGRQNLYARAAGMHSAFGYPWPVGSRQRPARQYGRRRRHPYKLARPVLPRGFTKIVGGQPHRQDREARKRVRTLRPCERRQWQAARQRDRFDLANRRRRSLRHSGKCRFN